MKQNRAFGPLTHFMIQAAPMDWAGMPLGTYVGFAHLNLPDSDCNYFDNTLVFTNSTIVSPETEFLGRD